MLDQKLNLFKIIPDEDLNLMEHNQSLSSLTAKALSSLDAYLKKEKPDLVLVQGDTTTTFVASLVAFYNKVKVGHIEAGLRTKNKHHPYPEEINRVLTTHIADIHFTPTEISKLNLLKEGIEEKNIFITGNTVIDTLLLSIEKARNEGVLGNSFFNTIAKEYGERVILITGHRRESFGIGFENICQAIAILADKFPKHAFVYPVHLNPNVREPVYRILSGLKNVFLIKPLDYLPFIALMDKAYLILTDSGGVQEEAPSLGKPVLIMRDHTERPEGINAGVAKLVGTETESIIENVKILLTDKKNYKKMALKTNPYGDGKASQRILEIIKKDILLNNF